MPVAEDLHKLTFDELLAVRGFKYRKDFAGSSGMSESVLTLLAAGWPGSNDSRAIVKKELEVDDDTLNAVLLCSWKAAVRRFPKD